MVPVLLDYTFFMAFVVSLYCVCIYTKWQNWLCREWQKKAGGKLYVLLLLRSHIHTLGQLKRDCRARLESVKSGFEALFAQKARWLKLTDTDNLGS